MHLTEKELEILQIIEQNSRIDFNDLAKMVDAEESEIADTVQKLEDMNVIVRYATIINWAKVDTYHGLTAMIDVKVTPKRGVGFNEVAQRIYRFNEVESVYLMSGAYDLSVVVKGQSMNEVAQFVSDKLSTLDSVISTTTHFILKKYKHDGTIFEPINEEDKRIVVSP
ncbi:MULTISPECIES: Lrp/AsnC family transcriptional regulator [Bacillaceae]|uniref:DNA-binding Lrp family transcriptional regulator n=1 Tax=Peribacillus huizhouensis TaxID=1501239 RepID=A0ABR6CPJ1_9BACI|nr:MULTISPECIES: Lrp/AsnC family transcriptional regulator [Bacillaceae]MBA9026943.1 DNA-binding Lrp family transcriptional regulator [Peribacillus huizhouensis]